MNSARPDAIADLPFLRGTTSSQRRNRRVPACDPPLCSQPKTTHRFQICHGSSVSRFFCFAHGPLVCGSRSMNLHGRAAFASSKRYGKSSPALRTSSVMNRSHCSRICLPAGFFPETTSPAYCRAIAA